MYLSRSEGRKCEHESGELDDVSDQWYVSELLNSIPRSICYTSLYSTTSNLLFLIHSEMMRRTAFKTGF